MIEGLHLSAVTTDNTTSPGTGSNRRQSGLARAWPGLRGFLAWWLDALASWLPQRVRAVFGLGQQRLLLRRQADDLVLTMTLPVQPGEPALRDLAELPWDAVAGEQEPLARLLSPRIANLPRWLLLPARSGLRRRLQLPAAAAERLREVLGFEIDRQTPFAANDVFYDARLIGRRGDGQIDAELVVVPRASLEAAVAALGPALGATLSGVDMADAEGRPLGVNLLPAAQRRRRRDPRAAWNIGLVTVLLVAAGAGLWQIRANREAAADAFETETKRRAKQAQKVADEKRLLVDTVEGLRFLQETRNGRPTTVEVMDELSRLLPDGTFLEKVSVEGEKVMIIGLSSEAASLVERLRPSKLWKAPQLTGALMPDQGKGKDRFTITADLVVIQPRTANKPPRGQKARPEGAP